eukprot:2540913-Prymnesium_polylepis.1
MLAVVSSLEGNGDEREPADDWLLCRIASSDRRCCPSARRVWRCRLKAVQRAIETSLQLTRQKARNQ